MATVHVPLADGPLTISDPAGEREPWTYTVTDGQVDVGPDRLELFLQATGGQVRADGGKAPSGATTKRPAKPAERT